MKQIRRPMLSAIMIVAILFNSCKKDPTANNGGSGGLNSGRAVISFNTSADFGNSKTFNVRNTATTLATTQTFGSSSRTMVLEASETYGSLNNMRSIHIDILVSATTSTINGPITIDMSLYNGNPQAHLALTYSDTFSGYTLRSVTGVLTITKLTATEIEGNFTANTGSVTITNGIIAGKF